MFNDVKGENVLREYSMIHALRGRMFYASLRGSAESHRGRIILPEPMEGEYQEEYQCSNLSSKGENIMNI